MGCEKGRTHRTILHIHRRTADAYINLWCPYCDEVVPFGIQHYYDDTWCTKCKRVFSPDRRHHSWPKGIDMQTGELSDK